MDQDQQRAAALIDTFLAIASPIQCRRALERVGDLGCVEPAEALARLIVALRDQLSDVQAAWVLEQWEARERAGPAALEEPPSPRPRCAAW